MAARPPLGRIDAAHHPGAIAISVVVTFHIFFNLATLLAVPALEKSGTQRWVRRFFLANGLITPVFAIAYFYPTFSVPILMIGGVPWAITVPGCLLALALFFHRTPQAHLG